MSDVRFFAPAARAPGDHITLPDDEAEHLTRVLRLTAGDRVRVFNGCGGEFDSVVEAADRAGVRVRLVAACAAAPEPRIAVTLGQAVLKGDKMDAVVRDAVMIGVAAIQPLMTERTESSVAALARGRRRERWERIAVSSAKQCGRAVVPPILEPKRLEDVALSPPVFVLVEPSVASGLSFPESEMPDAGQASVLIGPEGGWTSEELQHAATIGRLITLGGRTLRADAMALVALAALFARWREY